MARAGLRQLKQTARIKNRQAKALILTQERSRFEILVFPFVSLVTTCPRPVYDCDVEGFCLNLVDILQKSFESG